MSICNTVIDVEKESLAQKIGICVGDKIISVNNKKIRDAIDLMFYCDESNSEIVIERDKKKIIVNLNHNTKNNRTGIILTPLKPKQCRNNCLFCFVSQLPKGLRKSLFIKDEDFRFSFLYGNYITLTNLTDADKQRIIEQRLSPLYISVHSTDNEIRKKLLGNPNAPDVLKEIKFLQQHKIKMHIQIVLCPGYNDGNILSKTILDLYRFYPYVCSIAIVPIGLTSYRKIIMKLVDKQCAIDTLDIIHKFQKRFRRKYGNNIVYAADELYITAGCEFPPIKDYDELPQIENGVGMVPSFIYQSQTVKIPDIYKNSKYLTFTGVSFYSYLLKFINKIKKYGINIEIIKIENDFFGHSITVTGLLVGRDIIKAFSKIAKPGDILLIPDVTVKEEDKVFLDNVSLKDIEDILGVKTLVIKSTPKGFVKTIFEQD